MPGTSLVPWFAFCTANRRWHVFHNQRATRRFSQRVHVTFAPKMKASASVIAPTVSTVLVPVTVTCLTIQLHISSLIVTDLIPCRHIAAHSPQSIHPPFGFGDDRAGNVRPAEAISGPGPYLNSLATCYRPSLPYDSKLATRSSAPASRGSALPEYLSEYIRTKCQWVENQWGPIAKKAKR